MKKLFIVLLFVGGSDLLGCNRGFTRRNGLCIKMCKNNSKCPRGTKCRLWEDMVGDGICVKCRYDYHCPWGKICEDFRCIEGCKDLYNCNDGHGLGLNRHWCEKKDQKDKIDKCMPCDPKEDGCPNW